MTIEEKIEVQVKFNSALSRYRAAAKVWDQAAMREAEREIRLAMFKLLRAIA